MGAPPNLIPDGYDGQLSYTVQTYLRKLKKQVSMALYYHIIMEMYVIALGKNWQWSLHLISSEA